MVRIVRKSGVPQLKVGSASLPFPLPEQSDIVIKTGSAPSTDDLLETGGQAEVRDAQGGLVTVTLPGFDKK